MPPKLILPPFEGCICGDSACTIPYGYCHCGCDEKTRISDKNRMDRGWVKGKPLPFISRHIAADRPDVSKIRNPKGAVLISLTKGHYSIIDESDREKIEPEQWHVIHSSRKKKNLYAARSKGRRIILMHRDILGLRPDDDVDVDHINGDSLDNRRNNLRMATPSQNAANSGKRVNNHSGYKGVSWDKRRDAWRAAITHQGKKRILGWFYDPKDAHEAYCAKCAELNSQFANFG